MLLLYSYRLWGQAPISLIPKVFQTSSLLLSLQSEQTSPHMESSCLPQSKQTFSKSSWLFSSCELFWSDIVFSVVRCCLLYASIIYISAILSSPHEAFLYAFQDIYCCLQFSDCHFVVSVELCRAKDINSSVEALNRFERLVGHVFAFVVVSLLCLYYIHIGSFVNPYTL